MQWSENVATIKSLQFWHEISLEVEYEVQIQPIMSAGIHSTAKQFQFTKHYHF
jgi:hypothetical protein